MRGSSGCDVVRLLFGAILPDSSRRERARRIEHYTAWYVEERRLRCSRELMRCAMEAVCELVRVGEPA